MEKMCNFLSTQGSIKWVGLKKNNSWHTELQSRTPARAALYVPDAPNNREGPQAREPSKYLNGQSYGERLAKEAFWPPGARGSKKDSDRAITPVVEADRVPPHLHCQSPHKPRSCVTFMHNSHWGRAAAGKKHLVYMRTWLLQSCTTLRPCSLWPARLLC